MAETENHNDQFLRGYHDVPGDGELRSLSDLALFELLASCEPGSVKHMAVEAEKRRRESPENAHAKDLLSQETPGAEPDKPHNWHDTALGKVFIGVATATLAYLVAQLILRSGVL